MADRRWTGSGLALLGAVALLIGGCGSGALPRYATWDDFTRAAIARVQADRTITLTDDTDYSLSGRASKSHSTGTVSLGPAGVSQHDTSTSESNGVRTDSEVIILPDTAYTLVPPAQRGAAGKPYLKLDPNATDPLSLSLAAQVRASRLTGQRIYCFSQLGTPTVADASPVEFEGKQVMLYTISIDLTRGTILPSMTNVFRQVGLTTLTSKMHLDADDRILDCTVDQPFPGGLGYFRSNQRFTGFGETVTITAPPADQVTTTPAGA